MRSLGELVNTKKSLSLAGMCKNAGKTTVLNHIISQLDRRNMKLGLTSIGRDGESSDLVTGTFKPGIYVREGTILATASNLLSYCDITKEILGATGIHTPMGQVVIVRALSDGNVQIAGPSMNSQLIEVSAELEKHGAQKIIIDGAISRKSICSPKVAETAILCSGASYHSSLDTVVEETAFSTEILTLPRVSFEPSGEGRYRLYSDAQEQIDTRDKTALADILREAGDGWKYVYMEGAVTDAMIHPLLMSNISLKDKIFISQDSSKILLTNDIYTKMKIKGCSLKVVDETELLAVTINPFSAYGNHFDREFYMEKMAAAVSSPVYNVVEESR